MLFTKILRIKRPSRQPVPFKKATGIRKAPVYASKLQTSDATANDNSVSSFPPNHQHHVSPVSLSQLMRKPALVVGRQLEAMNVLLGYEQANQYVVRDPDTGKSVAYITEAGQSFAATILRQIFRTRRAFTAQILDLNGNEMVRIERPFQWWLSKLRVSVDGKEVGQVHERFHIWRRQYDLFANKNQFAEVNAPLLSWDFNVTSEDGSILASINKNFMGFAREIFTDTSHYVVRFESLSGLSADDIKAHGRKLSEEEKLVVLATAISIDFDYFSRSSGSGGIFGWMPFGFWGGGDDQLHNDESTDNAPPGPFIDDDEETGQNGSGGFFWDDDE